LQITFLGIDGLLNSKKDTHEAGIYLLTDEAAPEGALYVIAAPSEVTATAP
jgi:hypothetical protein